MFNSTIALSGIAFGAIIVATGPASSPNTYSNKDSSTDFAQYKTFGYFSTLATDNEQYESLVSNFLKVAVAQEMDQRGLTHSDNPDLLVNFYIHTQEKIRTRSVPTTSAYYGYRDPFYDPWMGYGGYETRVDQYTEGTLISTLWMRVPTNSSGRVCRRPRHRRGSEKPGGNDR